MAFECQPTIILGQVSVRAGLLTIGVPNHSRGITEWMPTIADIMRMSGLSTGRFGKNHLGDRDENLPTAHGFDGFFGNLKSPRLVAGQRK